MLFVLAAAAVEAVELLRLARLPCQAAAAVAAHLARILGILHRILEVPWPIQWAQRAQQVLWGPQVALVVAAHSELVRSNKLGTAAAAAQEALLRLVQAVAAAQDLLVLVELAPLLLAPLALTAA